MVNWLDYTFFYFSLIFTIEVILCTKSNQTIKIADVRDFKHNTMKIT